jgi:phosphoserine phosphatase RsbU/P
MNQRVQFPEVDQVRLLSRACARILTAKTEEELGELFKECLRGFYPRVRRCEIFTHVDGAMVPATRLSEAQMARAVELLRVVMRGLDRSRVAAFDATTRRARILAGSRAQQHGAILAAPLVDAGRLLGLLVIEADADDAASFRPLDAELLEGLTSLFAPALRRIQVRDHESVASRLKLDLQSARQVQRRFLPDTSLDVPGVAVHAEYLPAGDVGGDFYDVIHLGPGQVMAVIGDVSGKGMSAALLMSRISADFRRLAGSGTSPAKLLERIDRQMTPLGDERFVTALCLRIDACQRTITVANAGHVPPLLRRRTGEVRAFGAASGTPLGMLHCAYRDETLALEPNDIIILMTDGLGEILDRDSDRMGTRLLTSLLEYVPHDPKVLCQRVLAAVDKMRGKKIADDLTLVALQISG